MPTQATHEEIAQWLQGDDPRMAAWGATFAAKNHDVTMVTYLARLAEEWVPLAIGYNPDGSYLVRTEAEKARAQEMSRVLDALIQLHGTITPEAIRRLNVNFNAPAQILFARLPEKKRRVFAESIYAERQKGAEYWWMGNVRFQMDPERATPDSNRLPGFQNYTQQYAAGEMIDMAAAILANDPPVGFAASLLNETTVQLELFVEKKGNDGSMGGPCSDGPPAPTPKGWPEQWTYIVEMSWLEQPLRGEVLVPGSEIALTIQRMQGYVSCSSIEPFGSLARIRLLHEMSGVQLQKAGWFLRVFDQISYVDDASYQLAVQQAVKKKEEAFHSTALTLVAKGIMTAAEAESARPTLRVEVQDLREMKTPAVPEIKLPVGLQKVVVVGAGE